MSVHLLCLALLCALNIVSAQFIQAPTGLQKCEVRRVMRHKQDSVNVALEMHKCGKGIGSPKVVVALMKYNMDERQLFLKEEHTYADYDTYFAEYYQQLHDENGRAKVEIQDLQYPFPTVADLIKNKKVNRVSFSDYVRPRSTQDKEPIRSVTVPGFFNLFNVKKHTTSAVATLVLPKGKRHTPLSDLTATSDDDEPWGLRPISSYRRDGGTTSSKQKPLAPTATMTEEDCCKNRQWRRTVPEGPLKVTTLRSEEEGGATRCSVTYPAVPLPEDEDQRATGFKVDRHVVEVGGRSGKTHALLPGQTYEYPRHGCKRCCLNKNEVDNWGRRQVTLYHTEGFFEYQAEGLQCFLVKRKMTTSGLPVIAILPKTRKKRQEEIERRTARQTKRDELFHGDLDDRTGFHQLRLLNPDINQPFHDIDDGDIADDTQTKFELGRRASEEGPESTCEAFRFPTFTLDAAKLGRRGWNDLFTRVDRQLGYVQKNLQRWKAIEDWASVTEDPTPASCAQQFCKGGERANSWPLCAKMYQYSRWNTEDLTMMVSRDFIGMALDEHEGLAARKERLAALLAQATEDLEDAVREAYFKCVRKGDAEKEKAELSARVEAFAHAGPRPPRRA